MNRNTEDQVKGKYLEVKGKVQEVAGTLIDDPNIEALGVSEKIVGKAQNRIAESACAAGCGCMLGFRRV